MKLLIPKATTSKTLVVFIQDSSATDGSGLTGLAWNTAGLSWYYYREGAGGATPVTLASQTPGTWTSGGFVELDATNLPGWYELGVPDAVLATGVDFVGMQLKGAANMAPVNIEIQLEGLIAAEDVWSVTTRQLTSSQAFDLTGNITGNLSGNVGGIAGTITTLDQLDTSQDAQHATTQSNQATAQSDLDTLTADVDGVTISKYQQVLLGLAAGTTQLTDLGGGDQRLRVFAQNGTTPLLDITFDSNGQWTATTIDP